MTVTVIRANGVAALGNYTGLYESQLVAAGYAVVGTLGGGSSFVVPTNQNASVPIQTGVIYTVGRLLGSTSTLALLSGSDANLSLNTTTGSVSATAAIAQGATQNLNVRETNGTVAVEYRVVLAGGATAVTPTPTPTPTPTLNALTVSNGSGTVGTALSSTISGLTSGSSVALTGAGAAGLSISGAVITGTPTTAGAVNIVETLVGASNSPRTTSGVITVAAPVTSAGNFNTQRAGNGNAIFA